MSALFDRLARRLAGTEVAARPRLAAVFEDPAPADPPLFDTPPPVPRSVAASPVPPEPRPVEGRSPAPEAAPTAPTMAQVLETPGAETRHDVSAVEAAPIQTLVAETVFVTSPTVQPPKPASDPVIAQPPAPAPRTLERRTIRERTIVEQATSVQAPNTVRAEVEPVAEPSSPAIEITSTVLAAAPPRAEPTPLEPPSRLSPLSPPSLIAAPRPKAASPAAEPSPQPTPVVVRIDRIDVRVAAPPQRPAPPETRRNAPRLEDFLAAPDGGRR